jgi:hypothetical protein
VRLLHLWVNSTLIASIRYRTYLVVWRIEVLSVPARGVEDVRSNATRAGSFWQALGIEPDHVSDVDTEKQVSYFGSWQGAALSPPKLGPV